MSSDIDDLIETLLNEVTLSGSQGYGVEDLQTAVKGFYDLQKSTVEQKVPENQHDQLFSEEPPASATRNIDSKFLAQVWDWLCAHPDIGTKDVKSKASKDKPATDTAAVVAESSILPSTDPVSASHLTGKRLFASEDRSWNAIAGHGIDHKRIPASEFQLLSVIATHGPAGILQPELTRITGQDKRSVPRRTDILVQKGYIVKHTVLAESTGRGAKTSLLKLKKYDAEVHGQVIMDYDAWYEKSINILKSQPNWLVALQDLRLGLGIEGKQRESRALARCIRRMTTVGCINKVLVKEKISDSEVGKPIRCVQLMREPTALDRKAWGNTVAGVRSNLEKEESLDVVDDTIADEEEEDFIDDDDDNDVDSSRRVPPQWTPDLPQANLIFNIIEKAGPAGIKSVDLRQKSLGSLWQRPSDETMSRISDVWQKSQPSHLHHLAIVRDTARGFQSRSIQYQYRTYENFAEAVEQGLASWEDVKDEGDKAQQKGGLASHPAEATSLDKWGFPKIPTSMLGKPDESLMSKKRKNKSAPKEKPQMQPAVHDGAITSDTQDSQQPTEERVAQAGTEDGKVLLTTTEFQVLPDGRLKKPGRGRPTKAMVAERERVLLLEHPEVQPLSADVLEAEDSSIAQTEPGTRKRGRPPKSIESTPRKRGRPRKEQASVSETPINLPQRSSDTEPLIVPTENGAPEENGTTLDTPFSAPEPQPLTAHNQTVPKKRARPTKAMVAERERLSMLASDQQSPQVEAKAFNEKLVVKLRVGRQPLTNLLSRMQSNGARATDMDHLRSLPNHEKESTAQPSVQSTPNVVDVSATFNPDSDIDMSLNDENHTDVLRSTPRSGINNVSRSRSQPQTTKTKDTGDKGGVDLVKRKATLLEIVGKHGGVFPGNGEIYHVCIEPWDLMCQQKPERQTIANTIRSLVNSGELKKITFTFDTEQKGPQDRSIIFLPDVDPESSIIEKTKQAIITKWPKLHVPTRKDAAVDRSGLSKGWSRNFKSLDSLVVTRTAKGISWADKEAQELGFADAQARRQASGKLSHSAFKNTEATSSGSRRIGVLRPETIGLMTAPQQTFHAPSGTYGTGGTIMSLHKDVDLDPHPNCLEEILDMASALGFPAAAYFEESDFKFDQELERVKEWELQLIENESFEVKIGRMPFISHALNQTHVTPTQSVEERKAWTLRPAGGRAKIRLVPSAAQNNIIGEPVGKSAILALGADDEPAPTPESTKPDNPQKKKYKSRKRKVEFEEDDNENIVDIAGNRPYRKRNKTATSAFKDIERLVIAIALIRTVCGGLQMFRMNWDLVAHALSFRYEGNFLRQRWSYFRNLHESSAQKMQAALRGPFLAAYEKGELPTVNFYDLALTDFPALFEWVEREVVPLPNEHAFQAVELPKTAALLRARYKEEEPPNSFDQPKDLYFQSITDMSRHDMALAYVHGNAFSQALSPTDHDPENFDVLQSWCRAVAMTKREAYKPKLAADKLKIFSDAMIKRASRKLLEEQVLAQERKERQLPGRNYYLSAAFYKVFKRWPEPEYVHLRSIAAARKKIVAEFATSKSVTLSYHASDADLVVFHNMVGQGLISVRSILPNRNDDFDAPFPKITSWGYTDFDYRTKAVDRSRLTFPIVYEKRDTFTADHGLQPVVIPLRPEIIANGVGAPIPLWVDIHENLIEDAWDMVLRSILHLVVFRPGITADEIVRSHKGKLWKWEIGMVLAWMEKVGIIERWAFGREKEGLWQGGWKAGQWWYCTFSPEIASWKTPVSDGR